MAATQYVGARYVPLFYKNSDGTPEWRAGVAYEPLTIVTYNGNSYTSKIPVPSNIGNPSANNRYWASTGIYNQQVENLRVQVEELQEQADTTEANTNALMAHSFDPRLTGRKIVIITDSYGVPQDQGLTVWTTIFKNHLSLTEGVNCFTYARGGAGFANGEWLNVLQNNTPDIDLSEITDVFVAGGCNDYGQSEINILTAISAFRTACLAKYPNALITIATIGHTKQQSYRDASLQQMRAYYNAISRGIRVLTGTENALHRMDMYYDDVHPNSVGADRVGVAAACAFINGSVTVNDYQDLTLTAKTGFTLGTGNYRMSQHGNIITFSGDNRTYFMGNGFVATVTGGVQYNTVYPFATLSNNSLVVGNAEQQASWPIVGFLQSSGNVYPFTGIMEIFNGELYFALTSVAGGNSQALAETVRIIPQAVTANFDAALC